MDAYIQVALENIINITGNLNATTYVTQKIQTFGATGGVYDKIETIMKSTIFAIGASLLTLFMLMELVSMLDRAQGGDGGLSGIKLPANVLMKWGIFSFLYCNLGKILLGIQDIMLSIATKIQTSVSFTGVKGATPGSAVTNIMATITNLGVMQKVLIFCVVILIWLGVQLLVMAINVVLSFRMFEMMLLFMFAPIPLATLPSPDFKQTAINFLKNFAAITMQSAIIMGCFYLYNSIAIDKINTLCSGMTGADTLTIIGSGIMPIVGWLVVLGMAVFKSGSISKSILNAI